MKSNHSWLWDRLHAMTIAEVLWRIRQFGRMKFDSFRFIDKSVTAAATRQRKRLTPPSQGLEISYFHIRHPWNGENIHWQGFNVDPQTKVTHWHRINYRNIDLYGNPKLTWELNRHQFLRFWCLDSRLDPSEKATAVSHLILHWIEENPYGRGLNWCSSLEAALRILSWECAVETIGDDNFHPRTLEIINESVVEHIRHIRRYPSLYSSANNHLVGELLGRISAAAFFAQDQRLLSQGWDAWETMQSEIKKQVTSDGVSREKALYYHVYMLLFLKKATRYAEQLMFPVFVETRTIIESMQQFLNSVTDSDGQWFEVGDRDDGSFAALLPWESPHPITSSPSDGFHLYNAGGLAVWKLGRIHAFFRGGEFGYPAIAAHAHCDQLSVLFKVDNIDILTDSGTCSYHDNEKWRRYFKSSAAHNTVKVEHTEQADYGGPFLWNTSPKASMIPDHQSVRGNLVYNTSKGCISHDRAVMISADSNPLMTVTDILSSCNPSTNPTVDTELIWNFGEDVTVHQLLPAEDRAAGSLTIPPLRFQLKSSNNLTLIMQISCGEPVQLSMYYGNEDLPAGFISREFGQRKPIYQLRLAAQGNAVTFVTTISAMDNL